MKTLYLECRMGAAGDMLMAALSELVDQNAFVEQMNALGLDKVSVDCEKQVRSGISGTHMHVWIDHEEEHSEDVHEHDHEHAHTHEHHHHHHHHHSFADIQNVIENLNTTQTVKENALNVYRLLAEAESQAHNTPVAEIHFHEVGNLDAIVDIVGVCILMEMIGADRIYASPVATGSGYVRCAHGVLPVPAPATAALLNGIETYAGLEDGELCTPTGAALLRYFVNTFGKMPQMRTRQIGIGLGTKEFKTLNAVRAFLGDSEEDGEVVELVCNLDDQTPEEIGYAMDILLQNGALDVYTTSVHMKKNRPGIVFTCVSSIQKKDQLIALMFKHLTTLGIREYTCVRHSLSRSQKTLHTEFGDVRIKESSGYGVTRTKAEYDDLSRIASENDLSIAQVRERIFSKQDD